jgi:hypothetical protein
MGITIYWLVVWLFKVDGKFIFVKFHIQLPVYLHCTEIPERLLRVRDPLPKANSKLEVVFFSPPFPLLNTETAKDTGKFE